MKHLRFPYQSLPSLRLPAWLMWVCLLASPAWGQPGTMKLLYGTQPVEILEITTTAEIQDRSHDTDIEFFHRHFANTDFATYKRFYADGQCRVTNEDFTNWRNFIEGKQIVLESRSIIRYGGSEYSLMSYRMGPDGYQQYYPFAIKKEAGKWHLLDIESSEKLMDLKFFFAYIREDILRPVVLGTPSPENPLLPFVQTPGRNLSINSLLDLYRYRYTTDSGPGATSKTIFRPFSRIDPDLIAENTQHFLDVAQQYKITAEHQQWIRAMCREGNYSLALETILNHTGMESMVEISELLGSKLRRAE